MTIKLSIDNINTALYSFSEELYEAYPLEDGNVTGASRKFDITHPEVAGSATLTVNSSFYIDQGLCISKLSALGGLQDYMIDTFMKNHEISTDEPAYEIESEDECEITEELKAFIKITQKELDKNLRYNVREQVLKEINN